MEHSETTPETALFEAAQTAPGVDLWDAGTAVETTSEPALDTADVPDPGQDLDTELEARRQYERDRKARWRAAQRAQADALPTLPVYRGDVGPDPVPAPASKVAEQPASPEISHADWVACRRILEAAELPADQIEAVPLAVRLAHWWPRQGEMGRAEHAELGGLLRRVAELRRTINDPPRFMEVATDYITAEKHRRAYLAARQAETEATEQRAREAREREALDRFNSPAARLERLEAMVSKLGAKA